MTKQPEYRSDMIYAVGDMDFLIGRAAWDYIYFTVPDEKDPDTKVYYDSFEDAVEKTGLEEVQYLD